MHTLTNIFCEFLSLIYNKQRCRQLCISTIHIHVSLLYCIVVDQVVSSQVNWHQGEKGDSLSLLYFRTNLFQYAMTSPSEATEATSVGLNLKHFLGEHKQYAPHDQCFSFPNKNPLWHLIVDCQTYRPVFNTPMLFIITIYIHFSIRCTEHSTDLLDNIKHDWIFPLHWQHRRQVTSCLQDIWQVQ